MVRQSPLILLFLAFTQAGCSYLPSLPDKGPLLATSGMQADQPPDPLAVEPAAGQSVLPARTEWPTSGNCADRLGALIDMPANEREGLDASSAPFALLPMGAAAHGIHIDRLSESLRLPVIQDGAAFGHDCILALGPMQAVSNRSGRHVFRTTRLRSSFAKGSKRRTNPDVRRLEKALAEARKDERAQLKSQSVDTGDPVIDLIGYVAGSLIGTISSQFGEDPVEALEAELAATPSFVEEPVMATYSYDLTELEARRSANMVLALVEGETANGWSHHTLLTEKRFVALSDNRHPADKTSQHGPAFIPMTSTDLELWEAGVPGIDEVFLRRMLADWKGKPAAPLQLDSLFNRQSIAVRDRIPSLPPAPEPAAHRLEPQTIAPAAGTPLTPPADMANTAGHEKADLVRIGQGGTTVAFHIGKDLLIAPAAALPASSIVELVYPDGMLVYGLIEKKDETSGLARIFSPRAADPLDLDPVPVQNVPDMTHLPAGTPLVMDGKVRAIWLGNGTFLSGENMTTLAGSRS